MATKKVEEKKKVEVKKNTCEECGKSYPKSLTECPKCGYSSLKNYKKTFYDDEEEEDVVEFEEYDDEDELEDDESLSTNVETDSDELEVEDSEEELEDDEEIEIVEKKEIKNKKKHKKQEKYISSKDSFMEQNEDLANLIKILIVIILLVGIVYVVVAFLNGEFKSDKDNADDEDTIEVSIQNEKILASSTFNKVDKEYYVLFYDGSNEWAAYYSMIYENYKSLDSEDVVPMFWVDLNDKLNADVVVSKDEKTNPDAQKYSELKVSSPTLIYIKNGKKVKYYEGDRVEDKISRLITSYNK